MRRIACGKFTRNLPLPAAKKQKHLRETAVRSFVDFAIVPLRHAGGEKRLRRHRRQNQKESVRNKTFDKADKRFKRAAQN